MAQRLPPEGKERPAPGPSAVHYAARRWPTPTASLFTSKALGYNPSDLAMITFMTSLVPA